MYSNNKFRLLIIVFFCLVLIAPGFSSTSTNDSVVQLDNTTTMQPIADEVDYDACYIAFAELLTQYILENDPPPAGEPPMETQSEQQEPLTEGRHDAEHNYNSSLVKNYNDESTTFIAQLCIDYEQSVGGSADAVFDCREHLYRILTRGVVGVMALADPPPRGDTDYVVLADPPPRGDTDQVALAKPPQQKEQAVSAQQDSKLKYPEKWKYQLDDNSMRCFKKKGVPSAVTQKLQPLLKLEPMAKVPFSRAIENAIGRKKFLSYQETIFAAAASSYLRTVEDSAQIPDSQYQRRVTIRAVKGECTTFMLRVRRNNP